MQDLQDHCAQNEPALSREPLFTAKIHKQRVLDLTCTLPSLPKSNFVSIAKRSSSGSDKLENIGGQKHFRSLTLAALELNNVSYVATGDYAAQFLLY